MYLLGKVRKYESGAGTIEWLRNLLSDLVTGMLIDNNGLTSNFHWPDTRYRLYSIYYKVLILIKFASDIKLKTEELSETETI